MNDRIKCPHCERTFGDQNAVWTHSKAVHRGKKQPARPKHERDDEPSYAMQSIDASLRRAMGEKLDYYDSWLADIADGK
jgi:hypothetical protein